MPLSVKLRVHHCTISAGIQMWAIRPCCAIMLPPICETWLNKNKPAPSQKCTQSFPDRQWLALAGRSKEYFPNSWSEYMPRWSTGCAGTRSEGLMLSSCSMDVKFWHRGWWVTTLCTTPSWTPATLLKQPGNKTYLTGQTLLFGLNPLRRASRSALSPSWAWGFTGPTGRRCFHLVSVMWRNSKKKKKKEREKKKIQLQKAGDKCLGLR